MLKESYLYKKLKNKTSQCQTCGHYCVLKNNKKGKCGTRENKDGIIYSLSYGKACAINIDSIEKKPFFHFLPGTKTLSISSAGCNFACQNCQNWHISQGPKILKYAKGDSFFPKRIVDIAKKNKLKSISYTHTEPTVFLEYALDTMKLAKEKGIKNIWKTNGFLSKEAIERVSPYLDAVNIDLKSLSDSFYQKVCKGKLWPVLDALKRVKDKNIWLEVTTLAIPALNDSEKMFQQIADFIKKDLGAETPWHIARFSGNISWQMQNAPDTPIRTLEKAYEIGKKAGLKYVYTSNVAGLNSEDTYCPRCVAKAIDRTGDDIRRHDKEGKCQRCGEDLNIIG